MTACLSELNLELYLLEPRRSDLAEHVASCARCAARLAEMRRDGEVFEREVYPATVGAVVQAARSSAGERPRQWRWWTLAVPLAAAAALVAFIAVRDLQGGAAHDFDLSVYVEAPTGSAAATNGAVIPADAALRFEVEPKSQCYLWVLSVDPSGEIARLFPPKGDSAAEAVAHPPRRLKLPTRAPLNGQPGPERIFAVCTKSQVPWLVVKNAAAERLGKGDEAVRSLRSLDNLPPGSSQSSVLLEKRS